MTPKCPDCKRDQDDCVCVDPQKRIEELEREIERKMSAAAFVLKERDALQADNARLREALDKACIRIEENGFEVGEHWKTGRQALAATPEQSLAEYRNKVIEECADIAESYTSAGDHDGTAIGHIIRATKDKQ